MINKSFWPQRSLFQPGKCTPYTIIFTPATNYCSTILKTCLVCIPMTDNDFCGAEMSHTSSTALFKCVHYLSGNFILHWQLTNSMAYGTRRFNATLTKALQ